MQTGVLFRYPEEHESPLHILSLLEILRALADSAAELVAGSESCELPPVLAAGLQGLVAAVAALDDGQEAFSCLVMDHDFRGLSGKPPSCPDITMPLVSNVVEAIGRHLNFTMAGLSQLFDLARCEAGAMDAAMIALTAGRARVLPFTGTVVSIDEAPGAV